MVFCVLTMRRDRSLSVRGPVTGLLGANLLSVRGPVLDLLLAGTPPLVKPGWPHSTPPSVTPQLGPVASRRLPLLGWCWVPRHHSSQLRGWARV